MSAHERDTRLNSLRGHYADCIKRDEILRLNLVESGGFVDGMMQLDKGVPACIQPDRRPRLAPVERVLRGSANAAKLCLKWFRCE
jgi:hypothetical protein